MNRESIDRVFEVVDRRDFLPKEHRDFADFDTPLSIDHGQTCSQPYTVRVMLEWLDPQPGDKVLDVGSGSGWTTALLSELVKPMGQVCAVERVPELLEFGRDNAQRVGIKNAQFYPAGDELGLPEEAPFDRVLVSASADELPQELVEQVKTGGKMVIPVNYDILEISKVSKEKIDIKKHPGFVFVPLL